jgi:hypothetical protein
MVAVSYTQLGGKSSLTQSNILERIRIPRFDPGNPVHGRLAELSKEAHAAAARGDAQGLRAIEAEIDQQAAQVWGLQCRGATGGAGEPNRSYRARWRRWCWRSEG